MQGLRHAGTAPALEILKLLGEKVTPSAHTAGPAAPAAELFGSSLAPQIPPPYYVVPESAAVGSACGASGTLFNLEAATNALPQNEESVDFFLNGVSSGADLTIQLANDYRGILAVSPAAPSFDGVTGYYVNRATTGCKSTFEGALPPLTDPLNPSFTLGGQGDAIVVVNPANGNVYAFDLRFPNSLFGSTTTGVGISMTTKTNLLNTTNCPAGTHTPAHSLTCWRKGSSSGRCRISLLISPTTSPVGRLIHGRAGAAPATFMPLGPSSTPHSSASFLPSLLRGS